MGGRDIPFNPNEICDNCGKKGGYDFMGDVLCDECSNKFINNGRQEKPSDLMQLLDLLNTALGDW